MATFCKRFRVMLASADDWEDDAREIEAFDAVEAAEKWVEGYDADEHLLLDGGDLEVLVRNEHTQLVQRFSVTGEAIPAYYATEVES